MGYRQYALPGNLQLVDVLFVDLVEGGETVAVGGVTQCAQFSAVRTARRADWYRFSRADQRCGFEHPAKAHRQRHGENGGDAIGRAFFAGGLARKGQTGRRKASTPSANRREKSGQ